MTSFATRTVGNVISEIVMSRNDFSGTLLVLEGDEDVKLLKPRCSPRHCRFVLGGGKPAVIGAVAGTAHIKGVLGVVDDDHETLLAPPLPVPNLIRTETRDIECLILGSAALDRVLAEAGDAGKIHEFELSEGTGVREALVKRSLAFGHLRYLNARHGWNLPFDELKPARFVNRETWATDHAALLAEASKLIPGQTPRQLEAHLEGVPAVDPWRMLHGRDTLSVLQIGLLRVLGSKQRSIEDIMIMLRLAFDDLLFRATDLCAAIRTWEGRNPPFQVLKARHR
ncbi:MAG: hypothetical protein U0Q16_26430 [Bryobacteraceae bacterium]